jgi:hypothetical protein
MSRIEIADRRVFLAGAENATVEGSWISVGADARRGFFGRTGVAGEAIKNSDWTSSRILSSGADRVFAQLVTLAARM